MDRTREPAPSASRPEPDRAPLSPTESASDLLRAIGRAAAALRTHGTGATAGRLEEALQRKLERHMTEWGACRLELEEQRVVLDGETVYEISGETDMLACFRRDGVSHLAFLPGLEATEVHDFLAILGRARASATADEDVVTLLWERDFRSIAHATVESVGAAPSATPVPPAYPHRACDAGELDAADPDKLIELDQLVSHLPIGSCQLTDDELRAIEDELAREETAEVWRLVAELAAELALLDADAGSLRMLEESLVRIAERLTESGRPGSAVRLLVHLGELESGAFAGSEATTALAAAFARALSAPARLRPILLGLGAGQELRDCRIPLFLERLLPESLPTVLDWIETVAEPDVRRAVWELLLRSGAEARRGLQQRFGAEPHPSRERIRQALDLLEADGSAAEFPLVQTLAGHPDADVRLDLALALGAFVEGAAGDLWIRLLGDADDRVARMAVSALVESGLPIAAEALKAHASEPRFHGADPARKGRVLGAVARLSGDDALPWLLERIRPGRRRIFVSRRTRDTERAAVQALRLVGSASSLRLLRDLEAAAHPSLVGAGAGRGR